MDAFRGGQDAKAEEAARELMQLVDGARAQFGDRLDWRDEGGPPMSDLTIVSHRTAHRSISFARFAVAGGGKPDLRTCIDGKESG
jgi:hypothetical protein